MIRNIVFKEPLNLKNKDILIQESGIGKQYERDYNAFRKRAQDFTFRYAL